MLIALFTGWLFRREERYRKITLSSGFLFALAIAGSASVVVSQSAGFAVFGNPATPALAAGFGLVLGSVFLAVLSSFGFRWASVLASGLAETRREKKESLELFSMVLGLALCNVANFPLTLMIGILLGETVETPAVFVGAAGGFLAWGVGSIAWRWANLVALNLELNAIMYLSPAMALAWLYAFSRVGNVDARYLVVGVILIIAANAGVNATAFAKRLRKTA